MSPERIRVLHVLPFVLSGGVERRRLLLLRHLGDDFEQALACLTARGPVHDEMAATGANLHALGRKGSGIKRPDVHLRLHRLVREFRPHVLHGAIFEGMVWGGIAGLLQRVPVVLLEETSQPSPDAPTERRRSSKSRALLRFLAMRSEGVVAVAPTIRDFLVEQQRVPADRVHLILNGVRAFDPAPPDEVAAERQRLGFARDAVVLGGVGRVLDHHKRFSDLLRAIRTLRERGKNVHGLIVGEGEDRTALMELARTMGLESQVVFTGRREDRELFFGVMDVFVLSSGTEAAPLTLMEAMMAGRPVVATRVGGVPDIVVHGTTGLIVEPRAPEQIADAAQCLIEDPTMRATLAANAYRHAHERLTEQRYVGDVRALYRSLLTGPGPRRRAARMSTPLRSRPVG